jgi:hypothetical protein
MVLGVVRYWGEGWRTEAEAFEEGAVFEVPEVFAETEVDH